MARPDKAYLANCCSGDFADSGLSSKTQAVFSHWELVWPTDSIVLHRGGLHPEKEPEVRLNTARLPDGGRLSFVGFNKTLFALLHKSVPLFGSLLTWILHQEPLGSCQLWDNVEQQSQSQVLEKTNSPVLLCIRYIAVYASLFQPRG